MILKEKSKSNFFKEYYFVIIPILITFLLYSISLSYGFRNFDEDLIIKSFYVKKTFLEYFEKYLLVDWNGITKAQGFAFSGIENVHFCLLERPLFYLINFLFQAKSFLFHIFSLSLHCLAIFFLGKYVFELSKNKEITLFSGLIWAIHPTNVELVIWATSWPNLIGAVLYFYTLNKIASHLNNSGKSLSMVFISIMTLIQVLIQEYTISIAFAIFLTVLFQSSNLKSAFKISLPSFIIVILYSILRAVAIERVNQTPNSLIERILFLTPQTFLHELKLVLFPHNLTIDQLDLLTLDKNYFGSHHIFCIFILISFLFLSYYFRKSIPHFSLSLLLYLICISPFLQIIPLYSIVAERYNYFGSAFFIFGFISFLFYQLRNNSKLLMVLLIAISTYCCIRSYFRITEWKDSSTLFFSTINNSKSLFKKGIWTYNLAISQKDENRKKELLNLSTNLLNLFINNSIESTDLNVLRRYELDTKSLIAKAAFRISTNYEILNQNDLQLAYLMEALQFVQENTGTQSTIYKNLGTYYFQENDINKAIDFYKKSYLISPNPTINYAIAVCYLKLNDLINYEKYLKEAVSVISAYNVSPFKTYGNFLEIIKHDHKNAIKYYKIATLLENSPEPYILLSTLYLKLGQIDNAKKYINRGLYGFPENQTLTSLKNSVIRY